MEYIASFSSTVYYSDVIMSPVGVSNHSHLDCLLNCWLRRRLKKTSKLRVTGLVKGTHRWPVDSPHKRPVTRKMLPFDDVIMGKFQQQASSRWCDIIKMYINLDVSFPFSACEHGLFADYHFSYIGLTCDYIGCDWTLRRMSSSIHAKLRSAMAVSDKIQYKSF